MNSKTLDRSAQYLFLAMAGIFLYVGLFNIHQPIIEQHAFRQTQTALSAFYITQNGFSLAYETPVVGYPWSIPFEFPLYQWLVAELSVAGSVSLDFAGRLVNLLSTLLVCLPLYKTLRLVGIDKGAALYSAALYLSAPVYLFWASSFMIEGMALLLTVAAVYFMVRMHVLAYRTTDLLLFTFFLSLALLQKVTTAALPPLLFAAVLAYRNFVQPSTAIEKTTAIRTLAALVISFGIGYLWVKYTDVIKEKNEIGHFLTSAALAPWNYGSLEQRFSKEFLVDVVLKRIIQPSTFYAIGLIPIAAVFFLKNDHRAKLAVGGAMLLFVAPMLAFTNLHFVHDYYQTANLVFLMVALGISVNVLCKNFLPGRAGILAPIVLAAFLTSNLIYFKKLYYPQKSATFQADSNRTLQLAAFLRANTPVDLPIMVYGYDWSSEIAYYSERRSLTMPPWSGFEHDSIKDPRRFLPAPPSALVLCPSGSSDSLRTEIQANFAGARRVEVAGCEIYLTAHADRHSPAL